MKRGFHKNAKLSNMDFEHKIGQPFNPLIMREHWMLIMAFVEDLAPFMQTVRAFKDDVILSFIWIHAQGTPIRQVESSISNQSNVDHPLGHYKPDNIISVLVRFVLEPQKKILGCTITTSMKNSATLKGESTWRGQPTNVVLWRELENGICGFRKSTLLQKTKYPPKSPKVLELWSW